MMDRAVATLTASRRGVGTCDYFGCGTVFSIDPATGAEAVLYSFHGIKDGRDPEGGLTNVKGTLYGTTMLGGAYKHGTVFALKKP